MNAQHRDNLFREVKKIFVGGVYQKRMNWFRVS